jgi:hypothetical protein
MDALARDVYTAPPHNDYTDKSTRRQELAALYDIVFFHLFARGAAVAALFRLPV